MAKFEGYKDIYVFVEQKNGEIANVGYELISEARKLVASIPSLGFQVVGVLLGHNIKDKAQEVIAHGADKVIVVDDALLEGYSTQFYADALTQVIQAFKPDSFLTGATVLGRDLAPRVAARLNAGLTADATKIEIDQTKVADGEALLLVTRPTFGGNLFGTIICPNTRPQMATIRPNVFSMDAPDASRTGKWSSSRRSGPILIRRSSSRKSSLRYRKALTSRKRISWSALAVERKTAWIWSRPWRKNWAEKCARLVPLSMMAMRTSPSRSDRPERPFVLRCISHAAAPEPASMWPAWRNPI